MAYNYGLLSVDHGLRSGIVACCFGLLDFPGADMGPSGCPYQVASFCIKSFDHSQFGLEVTSQLTHGSG